MGFFSKVFKGIGKVFRKIGRGLKKVAAKFGKFMGKIGIIGQIGLSLLLPGIGSMFGKLAGSMINTTMGGVTGAIVKGAGQVLNAAVNVGTKVGSTFKSITEGVTKVLGEVATAGLDKLGLSDSTFGKYLAEKGFTGDIGKGFTDAVSGVKASVGDLFSSNTLTATNKYAVQAIQEQTLGMTREQYLESIPESLAETERDQILNSIPETLAPEQVVDKGLVEQLNYEIPEVGYKPAQATDSLLGMPQTSGVPTKNVTPYAEATGTSVFKDPAKALGEAWEKTKTEWTGEKVSDVFSTATIKGVTGAVSGTIQKAADLMPDTNISQFSGYVPTIDMSSTTDIGMYGQQQQSFDAVAYLANNTESMAMSPYGFNANVYNQAMQQRGYGTPFLMGNF
jgi:hypothetical protein